MLSPKEDRLFIIQAFGRLKERNAVPLLSKLLGDKNSVLRTAALDALGKIQDPNSVESILPLLFDDDPSIRVKAIHNSVDQYNCPDSDHHAHDSHDAAEFVGTNRLQCQPDALAQFRI